MAQISRTRRWQVAAAEASKALDDLTTAAEKLSEALEALKEVQSEYEEWKDNLPENLQGSALGEKLEAVTSIDLEVEIDLDDVRSTIEEADGADLPMGFGRD